MDTPDIQAIKEHVEFQLSDLLDFLDNVDELKDLRDSIETARKLAE